MDYEYLINATPFELWKRAEHWEENARFAQEELEKTQDKLLSREGEVAELTHRLEEMQDELLSREEAVIGMEAERDAFLDEIEKLSARQERKPIPGSFQDSDSTTILNNLKSMWQAEALEEAVNREMSEQFLTYWDVRITAMSLIKHAQELRRQAEEK